MLEISLASMFTEAISLTMVPSLMLALFSRIYLRVEVLPEPRNPARRMMGMGLCGGDSGVSPLTCDDVDLR